MGTIHPLPRPKKSELYNELDIDRLILDYVF